MRIAAMLSLLAVVPALAPAQGGDEAKKLFEAMVERLTKAKNVSLGFSIEMDTASEQVMKVKGSLAFTEGDRGRLELEGNIYGEERKIIVASTGTQLRIIGMPEGKVRNEATPKNLRTAFIRILTRSGISYGCRAFDGRRALNL